MKLLGTASGSLYRIRLKGLLDRSTMNWFGGIAIIPQEKGETLLEGRFIDQAALRGFLEQLWNLNFTILLVERVDNESE